MSANPDPFEANPPLSQQQQPESATEPTESDDNSQPGIPDWPEGVCLAGKEMEMDELEFLIAKQKGEIMTDPKNKEDDESIKPKPDEPQEPDWPDGQQLPEIKSIDPD